MDHFETIYASQAEAYHRMIAAEDIDGHLFQSIQMVCPLEGKIIYDLGAGTGRLPLLLSKTAQKIVAVDLHRAMLKEQTHQMQDLGKYWDIIQADIRRLPFPPAQADLVTAGWAIGHMRAWFSDDWKQQIGAVIQQMQRLVVNGGWLLIFETLGTGVNHPQPPSIELAEYYAWLENDWGFTRQEIATDYQFASIEDAVSLTNFFFGNELSAKIRTNCWSRVPEWTGVWRLQK